RRSDGFGAGDPGTGTLPRRGAGAGDLRVSQVSTLASLDRCRLPRESIVLGKPTITRSVSMIPTITAFADSPDRGQGLARDMRVRWAFEEVGQRYDVRLVSFDEMKKPAHLRLHPFGQIP